MATGGSRGDKTFKKTPKAYVSVGKFLQQLDEKKTSLRYILSNPKAKSHDTKFVLPLLKNIVRYRQVIDHLIGVSPLKDAENVNRYLLRVAVYEQTFYSRELVGSSQAIQCVKQHRQALDAALTKYLAAKQFSSLEDFVEDMKSNERKLPSYVRVNLIKTTTKDVVQEFTQDGFELLDYDPLILYESFLNMINNLDTLQFLADLHIPDLFIFNSRANVSKSRMYTDGYIILQNKASCFPPMLLNPPPDSVVLDACAAPGMKTSYLACLMKNEGRLYANDRDQQRADQMKIILGKLGAPSVHYSVRDFTSIKPEEEPYCDVQYILVDPSCSGTGNVRDLESYAEGPESISENRIFALSTLLGRILCHALKFPRAERVVYSTCSVHTLENEAVVERALEEFDETFELEEPPDYPFRTGNRRYLKMTSEKDMTNGFFVAILQRKEVAQNDKALAPGKVKKVVKGFVKKRKAEMLPDDNENKPKKAFLGDHLQRDETVQQENDQAPASVRVKSKGTGFARKHHGDMLLSAKEKEPEKTYFKNNEEASAPIGFRSAEKGFGKKRQDDMFLGTRENGPRKTYFEDDDEASAPSRVKSTEKGFVKTSQREVCDVRKNMPKKTYFED